MRERELARRVGEAHLLERLGGRFVLERSALHVAPVDHILAGFNFETIYEAQHVRVVAFAMALAPPDDDIAYPVRTDVWQGDIYQATGFPGDLVEAIVGCRAFVERHSDPRRFLRSRSRTRNYDRVDEEEAYLYLATGDLQRARSRLRHLSRGRSSRLLVRLVASVFDEVTPFSAAARERASDMLLKLNGDEAAAFTQLREWQDQTLAAIRMSRGDNRQG